ncbi:MAG: HAD family hydrolase [Spirochaetaceae bacterium]|jgi:putative hydrolase of the HAD superfamily|nr:HAD family hydrolase [Spirochaetaceae bacterium]
MGILGRGGKGKPFAPGIRGVAFDLDGTLYPNYRFYFRLFPLLLAHPRFFRAFAVVRRRLHRQGSACSQTSFYREQASLMASILGKESGFILEKSERLIYRGWEPLFARIRPFSGVRETLAAFRHGGFKLGLLSDFPPVRKISFLGLEGLFDAVLSTEETGRLKPDGIPFAALARSLSLSPEAILYVGNSPRYDIAGARAAGMHTALIRRSPLSTGRCSGDGGADFVFKDYRQLQKYVLGLAK